jgi:hypothetical protein
MPVISAPVSISARYVGDLQTASSSDSTVQPSAHSSALTTLASVSVCTMRASLPSSKPHAPSSAGIRSLGVPEKPMRRPNSIEPPRSWPDALSLVVW